MIAMVPTVVPTAVTIVDVIGAVILPVPLYCKVVVK